MAQTAPIFSTEQPAEQALYITQNDRVNTNDVVQTTTSNRSSLPFVNQPASFSYGNRSRLNFELAADYTPYFSLIRGLIEFNRSRELSFTFHRDTYSFETDIEASQLETLNTLLSLVNDELFREIRFKQKLKEVIRFEARYKAKKARLYATFL